MTTSSPGGGVRDFRVDLPNLVCPATLIIDDGAVIFEDRPAAGGAGGRWRVLDDFIALCAERRVRGKFTVLPYDRRRGMVDRLADARDRRQLEAYVAAVRSGLVPRFDITPEVISHGVVIDPATDRPVAGAYSAAELTSRAVVDLHGVWRFRLGKSWPAAGPGRRSQEPAGADAGLEQGWQAEGLDDSGWRELPLPGVWTEVSADHGVGWFRRRFHLPAAAVGTRLFLAVMGIEHPCAIYLNGSLVGEWRPRRLDCIEVTDRLRAGGDNLLALRIADHDGRGGVTGCIQLVDVALRPELYNEARWSQTQDEDTLERYLGRALGALRNIGLEANGMTSPWDFGLANEGPYARAVGRALRRVNGLDLAWYFVGMTRDEVVEPRLMLLDRAAGTGVVSVIASADLVDMNVADSCGDDPAAQIDAYITADGRGGLLPRLIANRSHLVLCGHWQCLEAGIPIYRAVFDRLATHHGGAYQWMTCSAIARYHAAARTAAFTRRPDGGWSVQAMLPCPDFTCAFSTDGPLRRVLAEGRELRRDEGTGRLPSGCWRQHEATVWVCVDLLTETGLVVEA